MKAKIEFLPTLDLIPYARNSRTHSDLQIMQIAGSIREFGFTNPILIDDQNGIVAGHGRVMAAVKLGFEEVPCLRLSHLSESQKRAYIIADNKLALNAGWDNEMLKVELETLQEQAFNLELTGFDSSEIEIIMKGWENDFDLKEKHGSNTDGIQAKITVKLPHIEDSEQAKEIITNALDAEGIEYEFG